MKSIMTTSSRDKNNNCDCDNSGEKLQPLESALATLLHAAPRVSETETVSLHEAAGRILAANLVSGIDVPPADNSAMDGYAIASADYRGQSLRVSQRIPAGISPGTLEAGTAARIFTGAFIPANADAVVMQENASNGEDGSVSFCSEVKAGQNIRYRGEDITRGETILKKGRKLLPQDIGLAASVGIGEVEAYRRIRVATFFTGSELVQPGQPLKPGQIYNSNQSVLNALLNACGCELVSFGITEDTLEATIDTFRQAASESDCIITSGGVSVGEEDHVRAALESLGKIDFWRVAIKPGKPVVFGQVDDTPVIGLPGNPVSVFSTFCLLARPFLLTMQQREDVMPVSYQVRAGFDWNKPGMRREFVRAQLHKDTQGYQTAILYPNQGSGVLSSTSWAHGFVEISEHKTVTAGDSVSFYPFSGLIS
jgi:molybdopterin molybdotransferase